MSDPVLDLFNHSIGVQSPWHVTSVEFSKENKRLDITVDYKDGTKCSASTAVDIRNPETRWCV
ncbi:hypothetical protein [Alicyclobacillus dauci]|uniref:Uncharacterized protein n=1 Tax=Alicyclobacillus dauci TaxID=1475485 RepID=A0ABY6Z6Q3_9BACL|nr:hypothetical protein [Alicyclobacillus dauci]WAH38287.1 hypothetical protein NZD86_07335 [Alicyclobacillus dauci]